MAITQGLHLGGQTQDSEFREVPGCTFFYVNLGEVARGEQGAACTTGFNERP